MPGIPQCGASWTPEILDKFYATYGTFPPSSSHSQLPYPQDFYGKGKGNRARIVEGKASGEGQPHMLPLPRTAVQQEEQRHPREPHISLGGSTPDMVELPPEVWEVWHNLCNHILAQYAPTGALREETTSLMQKFKPRVDPAALAQKNLREAQSTVRQLGNRRHLLQQQLDKLQARQQELQHKIQDLDCELEEAVKVQQQATTDYSTHVLRSKLLDPDVPKLQDLSANDLELLGDIPRLQALLREVGSTLSEGQRKRFQDLLQDAEFANLFAKRRRQNQKNESAAEWEDAAVYGDDHTDTDAEQAERPSQPTPGV